VVAQEPRVKPGGALALHRAFDEARFGPARTLDLRATLPTGAEAVRRAELWLRERQMAEAGEVLIVTGRGKGSPGGLAVVREAVLRLLGTLKRKGVVAAFAEHTAGSFVVILAPVRALFEAAPRTRHRPPPERLPDPAALSGLGEATRTSLRRLAVRAVETLGAPPSETFVRDEMSRQFALLSGAIAPGAPDREERLQFLIAIALDAFDDVK
jgi:hypothetical protein